MVLLVQLYLIYTSEKHEQNYQCPGRRFDIEQRMLKLQSKTNYITVENSPDKFQV